MAKSGPDESVSWRWMARIGVAFIAVAVGFLFQHTQKPYHAPMGVKVEALEKSHYETKAQVKEVKATVDKNSIMLIKQGLDVQHIREVIDKAQEEDP